MSAIDLARPEIRALKPYSSARMEAPRAAADSQAAPAAVAAHAVENRARGSVWLNANESPWPAVMGGSGALNRYPDPQPIDLVLSLAALYRVAPDQVLVGRGSDEAIDLLVRAFCHAGRDAIMISSPTFGMYAVSAAIQDAAIIDVPLRADFSLDLDALLARAAAPVKLVFVCSPNNPTGNLVPLGTIERLVATLSDRALVVVDEAYIEFAGTASATTLLARYDNVVVLRTLSKAHALAAARVGTLIARAEIVALLRRILPAYPLPGPCVEAALAALSPPALAATRARVSGLLEARSRLVDALKSFAGVREVYPTSANFVLVRCADARRLYERLIADGVVVRDVSHHAMLSDCLRISVGSDEDHRRLQSALGLREAAA